ncbi:MAG: hypothetical protein PHV74_15015 [Dehalococcoidia bacterium]|nr:hypothetical protein [Dehalococcoidia bacterium]
MLEERQKLFQELVQVMAKVMLPQTTGEVLGGQAMCAQSMDARLGKSKPIQEQPYGPVVLEQMDRMRIDISTAEEAVERLYEKTKMVTFPEAANQALTGGGEIDQVIPPVAEDLRESCRRVERLTVRINYLIARIGL